MPRAPEKYIAKEDLQHGMYYRGTCRNATVARWNGPQEKFFHWRQKFTMVFVENIKCPEDEKYFDVFYAIEEIAAPEEEIPFKDKFENFEK